MTFPYRYSIRWSLTEHQERAVECLRAAGAPQTIKEIAAALGWKRERGERVMQQLVRMGYAKMHQDKRRFGEGRYRPTERKEAPAPTPPARGG